MNDLQRHQVYHPISLTATGLFFAEMDKEIALNATVKLITVRETQNLQKEVEGRLRSRCAGLLDLRGRPHQNVLTYVQSEVVYLHRTVADFLKRKQAWKEITQGTKGTKFDPFESLLQSLVVRIKCEGPGSIGIIRFEDTWPFIIAAIDFARRSESSTGLAQERLLDELDKVVAFHFKSSTQCWYDNYPGDLRSVSWHDNYLSLMIRSGMTLYVQSKFRQYGKELLNKKGRPLLDYVCRPGPDREDWSSKIRSEIVETLLQYGANPNEKFNGFSPWQNA